jgi:addiction module HigA family antidote
MLIWLIIWIIIKTQNFMLKREMPPVHPGEILRTLFMDPLGISVKQMAHDLDVTPKTISALVNRHQGISVEMALRLSKAFGTSSDIWINMQKDYDLWKAREIVNLDNVRVIVARKKNAA